MRGRERGKGGREGRGREGRERGRERGREGREREGEREREEGREGEGGESEIHLHPAALSTDDLLSSLSPLCLSSTPPL